MHLSVKLIDAIWLLQLIISSPLINSVQNVMLYFYMRNGSMIVNLENCHSYGGNKCNGWVSWKAWRPYYCSCAIAWNSNIKGKIIKMYMSRYKALYHLKFKVCLLSITWSMMRYVTTTLREEPSQVNVILHQKLSAAKLSAVCTLYKQWLATSGCNCGLETTVKI